MIFPASSRNQKEVMGLDTALEFTRGNPAGMRAMLAQLHPARGNTTLVASGDDGTVLIGQVTHIINERPAYLTFLMPESAACGPILTDLLDELISQAGYLGAMNIIADAEDDHPAFPCLRKAGFSIYGWQSAWKLPAPPKVRTSGRLSPPVMKWRCAISFRLSFPPWRRVPSRCPPVCRKALCSP